MDFDVVRPPLAFAVWLAASAICSAPVPAQMFTDAERIPVTEDLAPMIRELFDAIESASDYRADGALPHVFQLPQHLLEERVCDEPCDVRAAYVPHEGIYLSGNLDPLREPPDRAVLLHELVHYLQQGHSKFVGMAPCERERTKEVEAFAIQNAYLEQLGIGERAVFYDDFDCEAVESER
jgi:hypothetical protein